MMIIDRNVLLTLPTLRARPRDDVLRWFPPPNLGARPVTNIRNVASPTGTAGSRQASGAGLGADVETALKLQPPSPAERLAALTAA
jgi:hypothetical protein